MKKMTNETGRKYVHILDVIVDSTSKDKVLNTIGLFLENKHKFSLFTPNPEILLKAKRDEKFLKILNSADLSIPDGNGLNFASKFLYRKSLEIIPGRKLFEELIKISKDNNWKLFLLGGLNDEAYLTKEKIKKTYKGIIAKSSAGPKLDENAKPLNEEEENKERDVIKSINSFSPDILFVGFGAPKQEKWIYKHIQSLEIGGAMAVGGTFSYFSGRSLLPPVVIEQLKLEWLWRLLHEPRRVLRIINALILFPLSLFYYKFGQNRV